MRARATAIAILSISALPVLARDIDADSGLVIAPGFGATKTHCTVCHTARRISLYRANRSEWSRLILRDDRHRKLPPLTANQEIILDYLAAQYAPDSLSTRPGTPSKAVIPE